jgi:hypothetical protein
MIDQPNWIVSIYQHNMCVLRHKLTKNISVNYDYHSLYLENREIQSGNRGDISMEFDLSLEDFQRFSNYVDSEISQRQQNSKIEVRCTRNRIPSIPSIPISYENVQIRSMQWNQIGKNTINMTTNWQFLPNHIKKKKKQIEPALDWRQYGF